MARRWLVEHRERLAPYGWYRPSPDMLALFGVPIPRLSMPAAQDAIDAVMGLGTIVRNGLGPSGSRQSWRARHASSNVTLKLLPGR